MTFLRTYVAPYTRKISAAIENSKYGQQVLYSLICLGFATFAMNFRTWMNVFGDASWKTPDMLGNSYRSPIYPNERVPFYEDIEAT